MPSLPFDFKTATAQGPIASASSLARVQTPGIQLLSISDAQTAFQNTVNKIQTQQVTDVGKRNIYGVERLPWVFTTQQAIRTQSGKDPANELAGFANQKSPPANTIIWAANPRSVSWQASQRATETKTKAGSVMHVSPRAFGSNRGSILDDPKITISFQSGSTLPQSTNAMDPATPPNPTEISAGLNNFYQFLSLIDQSKILTTGSGDPNYVLILYRSRIFPSIVLKGFFDPQAVLQFQDDSQNPNMITGWSATFTIYETQPSLVDYTQLKARFDAEGLIGFGGNLGSF